MNQTLTHRPAWVEIDLRQLRRNFEIINREKPPGLKIASVVKDDAYGHGAVQVAGIALEYGASCLATVTLNEALELRESNLRAPILLLGERMNNELAACVEHDLSPCISDPGKASLLAQLAIKANKQIRVHVDIDTGMSRYGARWSESLSTISAIANMSGIILEGVMSHFAMSDETDKSFALLQLERFEQVLKMMKIRGIQVSDRHICNTGGFLDLPQAHFDMVRMGILPLGVYPSKVCRRINGLKPIMSVKTRIVVIKELDDGDPVGYGMRYTASEKHRIGVLPVGYGDGYPRVRNKGAVLIHGKRAPIIGGNAMDAMMVDLRNIPRAKTGDEVVLMGEDQTDEISVHEIAALKSTVSYDILAGWRARLPRIYCDN